MNTMKPLKIFWVFLKSISAAVYFIAALALITGLSYIAGQSFLNGIYGGGSDTLNAYTFLVWFDRWYPEIPRWFPLQGMGTPLIFTYPVIPNLVIILTERITSLSLIQTFRLFGFISVPLTSLGIYLLVWLRFKNKTAALIASILYLLMPLSWTWLYDWGFYAESLSHWLVAPILISFDLYLSEILSGKDSFKKRLGFVGTVVFLVLAFIAHPGAFFGSISAIAVFSFIYSFVYDYKNKRVNFLRALGSLIWLGITVLGAIAFLAVPYYLNASIASGNHPAVLQRHIFDTSSLLLKPFLRLESIDVENIKFATRNISIPPVVWIPSIFTLLTSYFYSRKLFAYSVTGAIVLLFTLSTDQWESDSA